MSINSEPSTYRLRKHLSTTPGRLQLALWLGYLGALLFFLASLSGANQHRAAMKTIAVDATPSIVAAKRIGASLADADSNLANYLLGHGDLNKQARQTYDMRMGEVREALIAAAQNITYGEAERRPILRMQNGRDRVVELAAQSVQDHDRGDTASAVARYREVTRLVHRELLPASDDLVRANLDEINRAYARMRWSGTLNLILVLITGGGLALLLLATQQYLTRKTHRRVNPLLAGATVVTAGFLAYTATTFLRETHELKVAKQDCFDSIYALWYARAVAYDANGEESRWLLDRQNAATYEKAFFEKAARIARPPAHQSLAEVAHAGLENKLPTEFKGYLADELRNITFTGEREAASDTVRLFGDYFQLDSRIRSLENSGQHAQAVEFCIGTRKGESNWAYDRFDKRLGDVIAINQGEQDRAAARAFSALNGFSLIAAVAALAIAALAGAGLRPRLKEYAF